MEDYNQVIFCNYVWEELSKQPDNVVREFINIMVDANKHYIESGGNYPTIEYIMGMAIDSVKEKINPDCQRYGHGGQGSIPLESLCHGLTNESENESERETLEQRREKIRNSWINKTNK